jgi:hypothetical protein
MINDERLQRESSLIDTIRKKLPEFAPPTRNWYYFTKMPLPPTTKRTNTCSSAWPSNMLASVGKKCV